MNRRKLILQVAEALYRRAVGSDYLIEKVFQGTPEGAPVIVRYVQQLPPDTGAAKFWLSARRPQLWCEHPECEHLNSLKDRIRLTAPEQRRTRLLELREKTPQAIDGTSTKVDQS